MSEEAVKAECPKCGTPFHVKLETAFREHLMTVRYELAEGHRLSMAELGGSLTSLDKLLRAQGRKMKCVAEPLIEKLEAGEGFVAVTFFVAEVKKAGAK